MTDENPTRVTAQRSGPPLWRIVLVAGSLVVLAASAALTLGASPSPSATSAPSTTVDPDTTIEDGRTGPGGLGFGRGPAHGGMGRRDITVTAVNGSSLSLRTDDGWTRTITVTSDTTITEGGATIEVGDIEVGDTIVFSQDRRSDGSYTITAIEVVVPRVGGTVGEVTSSGFTVTDADGVSWTVTVSSSTIYSVDGEDGTKADVKAGLDVVVKGTQSGNTIAAASVSVRQPLTSGLVTAKTASTITIERRGGTTLTIKLDSSTTYTVNGETGSLDDITVGMVVAATGTPNSDGTFSATTVRAGDHGFGDGHGWGHGPKGDWDTIPTPSASPDSSGSTG